MSCKAMGHTDEAAKYAWRCCFAMLDYYGLNSLFLTTTPDDECSFRVRLYAKPRGWVSALFTIYSISELFVSCKILSLHWQMLIYSPFTGMCNKIIQKLNDFFLYHTERTNHYSHECFFWNELYQHILPSLQCSEDDCFAVLQKDIRLNHPGACSLEFQSFMQILMECMLQWDVTKLTTKGKGILGTVVAFSAAD